MRRFVHGVMLALLLIMMAAGAAATVAAQDPTEVPATEPPPTEVPATEPPATEPPPTEVPVTEIPATEPPAEPGALVIGAAVCPEGLSLGQIDPAECTEPAVDVEFYAANPNTDNVAFGSTAGDGLVSFPLDQFAIGGPEGAPVEVGMILGSNPYGAVSAVAVSCEPAGTGLASSEVQPGGASLAVQFPNVIPGDQVACEWFLSHGEPADDDNGDTAAPPVTQLPSTGTGAASGGPGGALLAGAVVATTLTGGAVARRVLRRESAGIR